MKPRKAEFVTFYSPGTFFAENTSKQIESRDLKLAVKMSETVIERHGAKPYGFRFETRLVSDPIPDGMGETLAVEQKVLDTSGMYFLGGDVETLDDVIARNDPREEILRSNMEQYPIVVVNRNSFRATLPFEEKDFVVDAQGNITECGDDPKYIVYRKKILDRK